MILEHASDIFKVYFGLGVEQELINNFTPLVNY